MTDIESFLTIYGRTDNLLNMKVLFYVTGSEAYFCLDRLEKYSRCSSVKCSSLMKSLNISVSVTPGHTQFTRIPFLLKAS